MRVCAVTGERCRCLYTQISSSLDAALTANGRHTHESHTAIFDAQTQSSHAIKPTLSPPAVRLLTLLCLSPSFLAFIYPLFIKYYSLVIPPFSALASLKPGGLREGDNQGRTFFIK